LNSQKYISVLGARFPASVNLMIEEAFSRNSLFFTNLSEEEPFFADLTNFKEVIKNG